MTATILLAVLILIALLAPRYGADSRSYTAKPRYTATPWGDVKRLRSAVRKRVMEP
ncbi:hypothetical protein GCM10009836_70010 [Pseudonocardia ailaonensis]|uniref:Uncharacterized protein n=1 Tax=Pseudonocardia ailaonensis TaxID=367279 RepID=A0ABN2NNT1_9PSEU